MTDDVPSDASIVRAPFPGVFYRAPSPGEPPFIEIGSTVEPGDTVGFIELMKTYHALTTDERGVVAEILVSDGDLIEVQQAIVRLDARR
jgi:acetyl-CoA carboxylase biotin carboxyl carrier protein